MPVNETDKGTDSFHIVLRGPDGTVKAEVSSEPEDSEENE